MNATHVANKMHRSRGVKVGSNVDVEAVKFSLFAANRTHAANDAMNCMLWMTPFIFDTWSKNLQPIDEHATMVPACRIVRSICV